jgi:hypothetical protein
VQGLLSEGRHPLCSAELGAFVRRCSAIKHVEDNSDIPFEPDVRISKET